ncbi:hypothetical protein [Pseudonocardia sp. T1-2H]|uniref:hypothetical protein n=1 Tax=Pseudonocardia sp. T1-2H TaxID=3128899 RepID=UPI003100DAE5
MIVSGSRVAAFSQSLTAGSLPFGHTGNTYRPAAAASRAACISRVGRGFGLAWLLMGDAPRR